jgi:hypothetical protein
MSIEDFDQIDQKTQGPWTLYNDDLYLHAPFLNKGIIIVKPADEECTPAISNNSFSLNDRTLCFQELSDKKEPGGATKKAIDHLRKMSKTAYKTKSFLSNTKRREEVFLPLTLENKGVFVFPWTSDNANADTWASNFNGFEQFVSAGCLFGTDLKGRNNKGRSFPLIKHDIEFYDGEVITSIIHNRRKPSPYEEMFFSELESYCNLIDKLSSQQHPKKLFFHLPYLDYVLFAVELYLRGKITDKALTEFITEIFWKKEQYATRIKRTCYAHGIKVTLASPFENIFHTYVDSHYHITQPLHEISNRKDIDKGTIKSINDICSKTINKIRVSNIDAVVAIQADQTLKVIRALLKEIQENELVIGLKEKHVTIGAKLNAAVTEQKAIEEQLKAANTQTEQQLKKELYAKEIVVKELRSALTEIQAKLQTEFLLVQKCLERLKTNDYDVEHRIAWEDLLSSHRTDDIHNLEDLFKLANAITLAIAAAGRPAYKTCSLLPLSEKQIQISYSKYSKDSNLHFYYPAIVNLTFLDPIVSYSPATNGLLFYFDSCKGSLIEVIAEADTLINESKIKELIAEAKKLIDEAQKQLDKSKDLSSTIYYLINEALMHIQNAKRLQPRAQKLLDTIEQLNTKATTIISKDSIELHKNEEVFPVISSNSDDSGDSDSALSDSDGSNPKSPTLTPSSSPPTSLPSSPTKTIKPAGRRNQCGQEASPRIRRCLSYGALPDDAGINPVSPSIKFMMFNDQHAPKTSIKNEDSRESSAEFKL